MLTTSSLVVGLILSLSAVGTIFTDATPYSKFGSRPKIDTLPSKKAMVVIYLPSVIACILVQRPSFNIISQFDIVHALVLAHFVKRVMEVLFVHIYKSTTDIETMLTVMGTYTTTTLLDLLVVRQIPTNVFSSKITTIGVSCVIIGEAVNAYHHILLRQLRLAKKRQNQAKYTLPRGGLFDYCVAPHYLSEQLAFLGFILCSQNVVTATLKLFPFIYLSVRANKTYNWYSTNLTDKQDKADLLKRYKLIPFVW